MRNHYRTTTFLIALILAVCINGTSQAARLDFLLTINNVTNTWELAASTDAAGGIAAIVVNLTKIETGIGVAPRSAYQGIPFKGFTIGYFELPNLKAQPNSTTRWQAFAGQLPLDTSTIVYGVGYQPVPDSLFGVEPPFTMIGSALTVPTVFYTGTYNPANGEPDYHTEQVSTHGNVWETPPAGGYQNPRQANEVTLSVQSVGFNRLIVPEPAAWMLALIGVPAAVFLRRRSLG